MHVTERSYSLLGALVVVATRDIDKFVRGGREGEYLSHQDQVGGGVWATLRALSLPSPPSERKARERNKERKKGLF